jgi:hypothetical protein
MADVIRAYYGNQWTCAPKGAHATSHAARIVSAGKAVVTAAGVRLKSEFGPLLWDTLSNTKETPPRVSLLEALGDDSVAVAPNERVILGRADNCPHDDLIDLSLKLDESMDCGLSLSSHHAQEGDVLMTLWPGNKAMLPARVLPNRGHALLLEPVLPQGASPRCFVIDPEGHLLSVGTSMGNTVAAIAPTAFSSWMMASGSRALQACRFSFSDYGDGFQIWDGKAKRKYMGRYKSASNEEEKELIQWLLRGHGLGAILPRYELENAAEDQDES